MKKQILILTAVIVMFAAGFIAYYQYTRRDTSFHIEKHYDDDVITIDNTDITIKELLYYIMSVEDYVNQQAAEYNTDDIKDYWNTHFSAGMDSAFVHKVAKDQVYEVCVTDYVYEAEAKAAGFELTKSELTASDAEAVDLYDSMTDKQKSVTGFELDEFKTMRRREKLATAYAASLVDKIDWSYTVNSPSTELSYGGSYFQDNILDKHKVTRNDKLWKKITLGSITVN